jgi:cyclic pyranopterin phosphate synthase
MFAHGVFLACGRHRAANRGASRTACARWRAAVFPSGPRLGATDFSDASAASTEVGKASPRVFAKESPRASLTVTIPRTAVTVGAVEQIAALRVSESTPGLPKALLTDTHGRHHSYLRISLTEKCNLRCLYCMPEEGIDLTANDKLMTTDEVIRVAKLFVAAGVTKIRLTGGEPTVRRDLGDIVKRLRALDGLQTIAITTNGITLHKKIEELRNNGLTHVNISLDTLVPAKFEFLTRRKGHDRVLRSIKAACALGFDPVKVNVVLMRGVNDDEILDFVEMTRHDPINVRFIEYMPFDGNKWETKKVVSYAEAFALIEEKHPSIRRALLPGEDKSEVGKNFKIDNHTGSVSFVTSMTHNFCGSCNRLRVMADGNLKVCLFGQAETSLRDAMRAGADDEALMETVSAAVKRKAAAHAGMHDLKNLKNRSMIKIGG